MYTIGGKVKVNAFLGTGQVTPLSATSFPTSRVDGASTRGVVQWKLLIFEGG
jgi:hypothetical protein